MATTPAPAQSNIQKGLTILKDLIQFAPTVGPAVSVGVSLAEDISAALAANHDVDPEKLAAGERLTSQLVAQIQADAAGK